MVREEKAGKRVLLVEDNEKILRGNKRMLSWEGYVVDTATTIAEAFLRIKESVPHVIVLDIMLPDGSGLDFLKTLREGAHGGIPVLILTGLSTQEDIIRGLTEGGDDYLTKPYDFPILLARVEALLRRAVRVPTSVERGGLRFDLVAHVAQLGDVDLLLTQKEFSLLLILVQNTGRYLDAEYLYEKVWKMPLLENTNALKSTIKRLRSKLEGSDYTIEWSRDEGYTFF